MAEIEPLMSFIRSPIFWEYHGWGMTIMWLVGSFVSIALRKKIMGRTGSLIHGLLFFLINTVTLFLSGAALYRVYPNLNKFWDWSLIKQAHIVGGVVFSVMIIFQFSGGVALYFSGGRSALHRSWGTILSIMLRIVVVFGWLLGTEKNEQNMGIAVGCFVVAMIETAILYKMPRTTAKTIPSGPAPNFDRFAHKPKRN